MAGITLSEAQANLDNAKTALLEAQRAQSYSISDRQLARAPLADLERSVHFWSRLVRELTHASQNIENPGYMVPKWQ